MATINTTNAQTFVSGDEVTPTKLNALGLPTVTVSDIVNADISASAAIAHTKLANITAASVLMGNASNAPTATAITGDVTVTSAGVTAIGAAKVTPAMLNGAQSGVAPIYGCRAWVNFDGTRDSTGAASTANTNRFIRSAGNVTSVMRNGLGNYTVNFVAATPMPDALYAVTFGGQRVDNIGGDEPSPQLSFSDATTSSFKVGAQDNNNDNYADAKAVCVAVFR
jgi:hypothetical protein